jgi:hypothetical protein
MKLQIISQLGGHRAPAGAAHPGDGDGRFDFRRTLALGIPLAVDMGKTLLKINIFPHVQTYNQLRFI